MAEQKSENTAKRFLGVQFPQMDAKYDVKLEFNAEEEALTLQFTGVLRLKDSF